MSNRRSVEIAVMDNFFLYLPLYFAHYQNYFGFIPPEYDVKKPRHPRNRTDDGAFEMLIRDNEEVKDVMFAVCDPTVVLRKAKKFVNDPVVLGSLITNYTFWAVNHNTYEIRQLTDLGLFDEIICYKEGTTSYGIANRIYNISRSSKGSGTRKDKFIKTVEPMQEFTLLQKPEGGKNKLALSPDVLTILNLLSIKDEYQIVFEIGTVKEFADALVTALLSRRQVVDSHPDLVEGLTKALQASMMFVREAHPEVIKLARAIFDYPEHVEKALKMASDSKAFPESIEVKFPHWQRAVEAMSFATDHQNEAVEIVARESFDEFASRDVKYAQAAYNYAVKNQDLIEKRIVPYEKMTVRKSNEGTDFLSRYGFELIWGVIALGLCVLFGWWESVLFLPIVLLGVLVVRLKVTKPSVLLLHRVTASLFFIFLGAALPYISGHWGPPTLSLLITLVVATFAPFWYDISILSKAEDR